MRQIFTGAFLLLAVVSTFAQHVLTGKVMDENNRALVGATVVIQNAGQQQKTSRDGTFRFEQLKDEHYVVETSFVGYETSVDQATTNKELIVKLQPKAYSINEVTVRSLRANDKSPVAYSNVNKETLTKNNLGQDIPYLLSQTPSFVASSDAGTGIGYTNFRIRGTDASRINVTINGIPYNDADEQGTFWVDVPDLTSSLESIQIQRGVGTSTNGAGAFGANINMQTDNFAQKASGEISASYGSFNSQKGTVKASSGLINKHWAIDTRLSSVKSDGYIDRASVNMKSYFVQAGYYDEKTTVKFISFGGTEKTYHAWDGIDSYALPVLEYSRTYNPCGYMGKDASGNKLYYKNQTDNYDQTNYQLHGIHIFSPELNLNIGLHYTPGEGYYEEYKRDKKLVEYNLHTFNLNGNPVEATDLVRQKKMDNNFAGGIFSLNYQRNKLNVQLGGALNNYWGKHWGEVIWVKNYIGNLLPNTEYYRNSVSKWDGNIYLKANYELSTKTTIYADLQYRKVTYRLDGTNDEWDKSINAMQTLNINKKFNFFNPKAGLFYRPNSNNELFTSFAMAHREPTRTNYTDGSASTWPKPETLYDFELGYKFHNDFCSFGANTYFMNYHNQLVLTGKINDIGEALTENISSSYRSGIELVGSIKPFNCLRWDVTATFSHNRIINFVEAINVLDDNWEPTGESISKQYSKTPIAYSPEILGNSTITFSKNNFEIGLQSQYVGKQFIDNTGQTDRQLPDYFLNNLRLAYSLPVKGIRALDFTVIINNLFNKMYISNAWSSPNIAATPKNPVYDQNSPINNYFYCFPQAGTNFLAGITLKF